MMGGAPTAEPDAMFNRLAYTSEPNNFIGRRMNMPSTHGRSASSSGFNLENQIGNCVSS